MYNYFFVKLWLIKREDYLSKMCEKGNHQRETVLLTMHSFQHLRQDLNYCLTNGHAGTVKNQLSLRNLLQMHNHNHWFQVQKQSFLPILQVLLHL